MVGPAIARYSPALSLTPGRSAQAVRQPLMIRRRSTSSSAARQETSSPRSCRMIRASGPLSMEGLHPPQNFMARQGFPSLPWPPFLSSIQARITAMASRASLSSSLRAPFTWGIRRTPSRFFFRSARPGPSCAEAGRGDIWNLPATCKDSPGPSRGFPNPPSQPELTAR